MLILELLSSLAQTHPIVPGHNFTYGTAGFRMKADLLDSVMFAVGILAVLRSKSHNGKTVGVMVTASHNPEQDNGVKLVEPLGEMLDQAWEQYAIWLANARDAREIGLVITKIVEEAKIDLSADGVVVVARDTRPSGIQLVKSFVDGVTAMGAKAFDYGILTTPQLHYITRCLNTKDVPELFYGDPTVDGYFRKLALAFKQAIGLSKQRSSLQVDCANGVGGIALKELVKYIGEDAFSVKSANTDLVSRGVLNNNCGADYVKLYQKSPNGVSLSELVRACSLDGDADRIVFYYMQNGVFKLLDGDKIATLAAGFIMEKIIEAKVTHKDKSPLTVGVVQTAYANGSSTSYVRDVLKVPVVFTPTGVKHLHHAAAHFDVGVYFEANGHGTVLFSANAVSAFKSTKGTTEKQISALQTLSAFSDLINQTVGDALSDMLMVEAILAISGQNFFEWNSAYTDLPSRQKKVKVSDRTAFVPIKADTELKEPQGLQDQINHQVSKFSKGRCFVRPSGTEDVVRVYAEAETTEDCEILAETVCGIVFDFYGGAGERPVEFRKINKETGDSL